MGQSPANDIDTASNIKCINSLFQENVLGLCICAREFMTQLKEKGKDEGHIILIKL